MSGETDLDTLLRSPSPELHGETYVFATLPGRVIPSGLAPRMIFEEPEGTTLILTRAKAEAAGLAYEFPCRMITLKIHSSLAAVGLIARIASMLAREGISVNPVSGFFHDHLFVPEQSADEALALLLSLASEARNGR